MTARQAYLKLSALALEVDEVVDDLEREFLSDAETMYISVPLAHLTLAVSRIGQVVYESRKLDQRPRLQRFLEAA